MNKFLADFEDPGSVENGFECSENCDYCRFDGFDDCQDRLQEKLEDDYISRKIDEMEEIMDMREE